MAEEKTAAFQVRGQDPLQATPALFSNFLAISRVGTDVQLEFIFLDLNQIALIMQNKSAWKPDDPRHQLTGKTVAKIVMPGGCFVQIKDHVNQIIQILEKALTKAEVDDDIDRAQSM